MAIDIFPKTWRTIPPITAVAMTGHPLCPKFGFVYNSGIGRDLVTGVLAVPAATPGSVLYSATSARGYTGIAREHAAVTDETDMGVDNLLLPTTNCTIVLAIQKTDATLRNCVTFGDMGAAAGNCCDAYLPFSDGKAYWDFGGQTAGVNRVVTAGTITAGDDIWALTVGPREMAIYQNGVSLATAAINPTRTNATATWKLGNRGAGPAVDSDLLKHKFTFIYHRQLSVAEIMQITFSPFCWVDPRP